MSLSRCEALMTPRMPNAVCRPEGAGRDDAAFEVRVAAFFMVWSPLHALDGKSSLGLHYRSVSRE